MHTDPTFSPGGRPGKYPDKHRGLLSYLYTQAKKKISFQLLAVIFETVFYDMDVFVDLPNLGADWQRTLRG